MLIRYLILLAALIALVAGMLLFRQPTPAQAYEPRFEFPANYHDELVHYATIDRPDNRSRDIFISPGAAEIVAGNDTARLPGGTVIVIEAHRIRGDQRTGLADNIHVAVKRENWHASDYATDERAGDWNFFIFEPETGAVIEDGVFDCFDCHANNSEIDFIFTRDELGDFGDTGDLQREFCPRPDRLPCN